jgi:hypothetical protein
MKELQKKPIELLTKPNIPPVSFVITVIPRTSANIQTFAENNQSRLVNHNSTMLSGIPAYQMSPMITVAMKLVKR